MTMNTNRLLQILMLMLTSTATLKAQQVSVSEAMDRAKAFLQSDAPRRVSSASQSASASQLQLAYTCMTTDNQKVCYYVFNRGDDEGFIIMGGDEVAEEVLAHSDSGNFDFDRIPDNFKWWLQQYQLQITSAMTYAETLPETLKAARARAKVARRGVAPRIKQSVEPLLTTMWGQNNPYDIAIPSLGDNYDRMPTGCVATAMAQVMKYYNYPEKGKGSNSFQKTWTTDDGTITRTFTADFGNTTYDWANMTNTYNYRSTQVRKEAVATLMYHCGVSVNMNYGQYSSGASSVNVPAAMINHFGYNNALRCVQRDYYSDDTWERMIYNELTRKRPVYYFGHTKTGGHAFVCDGYRASDETYHMNWGWDGDNNCYVKLTGADAIKPGGTGTGGGAADDSYNLSQGALLNVIPEEGGYETPIVYNYTNTISMVDGSDTIRTYPYVHDHGTQKILTLTECLWNNSRSLTSFNIGVKATETTTGLEYYFDPSNLVTLDKDYYDDYTCTFDVDQIPYNGTYQISMVARNTATPDEWYEVGDGEDLTLPTVTITSAKEQEVCDVPLTISGTSVQVSRTLQVTHSSAYTGNITYTSSNPEVATVDANGLVTGVAEGTTVITAVAEGNTYFNATEEQFSVEVTPYVEEDKSLRFTRTPYFEMANPWTGNMILHLPFYNGDSQTFDGPIYLAIQVKRGKMILGLKLTIGARSFYDARFDLTKYKEYIEEGKGNQYSIWFYADEARTMPFNIPSMTYVYQDYLAGDCSGDNDLTTDDIEALKSAIIQNTATSHADFNNDGKVDILDITKLIEFLKEQ